MKNKYKLTLLFIVFFISMIPIIHFLFTEYKSAEPFILNLLSGYGHISIDLNKNQFMIVSHIVLGLWSTSLSYMIMVIGSTIVFCISLAFIVRLLFKMTLTKKKQN